MKLGKLVDGRKSHMVLCAALVWLCGLQGLAGAQSETKPAVVVPKAGVVAPQAGAVAPQPSVVAPKAGVVAPKAGVVVPQSGVGGVLKPKVVAPEPAAAKQRASSASLLPTSTRFWVSADDLSRLQANLAKTELGKLAAKKTLTPFFDSFRKQVRDGLNRNGVKFGLDLDSVEKLKAGEIAIAGVLPEIPPGGKAVRGSHGIVVLIDVTADLTNATELFERASKKMIKRGGKQEKLQINGTDVTKWSFEVVNAKLKRTQNSWIAICEDWILASDNETIFRDVLSRVKAKKEKPSNLAASVPYQEIKKQTAVSGVAPDLEWFVDPIGYSRLADALARESMDVPELQKRPLETLSREGLDALKAVGGFVSFATTEHDVLHRTMVYVERKKSLDAAQRRLLNMLDFSPAGRNAEDVPNWVPENIGSYFAATWNVQKAWKELGHFVDLFQGEGTMAGLKKEMKVNPRFKVDLDGMFSMIGKRATVITAATEPITESSEKMLIGIELNEGIDGKLLIDQIKRMVEGKMKKLAGFDYVIDDRVEEAEKDPYKIEIEDEFPDEEFPDEGDDEFPEDDDTAKEFQPRVTLFNRRFFVIRDNTLFVCNDKEYLKKILLSKPSTDFAKSSDVKRLKDALAKLTDSKRVRFRMHSRLDKILKTNYEMMRTGKMAESETFIARILNQVYGKKAKPDEKREQQIDGSKLPANFETEIAPYLGLSGWAMEVAESGWKFSGCVVSREPAQSASKVGSSSTDSPKLK